MPWITILITLLSFFVTKTKTGSTSKAAMVAALAGGATYAYTHSDFAAGTALAEYDGVSNAAGPIVLPDGTTAKDANGVPILAAGPTTVSTAGELINAGAKVLTSWGATGTAAVIGTTAVATSSSLKQYLPWLLGAGALILLTR